MRCGMKSRTIPNEINFASVFVAARALQCWAGHRRDRLKNKFLNIEGRHAWAKPTHRGIAFSVKLISFRIDSAAAQQPASQPANKQASKQVSKQASKQHSKPASQPASQPASHPANQLSNQPASQPASTPAYWDSHTTGLPEWFSELKSVLVYLLVWAANKYTRLLGSPHNRSARMVLGTKKCTCVLADSLKS